MAEDVKTLEDLRERYEAAEVGAELKLVVKRGDEEIITTSTRSEQSGTIKMRMGP